MKRVFIHEKAKIQEDSWTHGEWRQYVAYIDADTVVICRASIAPFIWAVIGFAMLLIALLVVLNVPYESIDWLNLAVISFVGFVLLTPALYEWLSPFRWMVQLYPPIKKNEHGRFMRDYLDV